MKISLVNPVTNQIKSAKIGFSWTTLFFGFWPALFRGDWLWFIIMFITEFLLGFKTYAFGSLVICIIFAFIYNKIYINSLLNNGWVAADSFSNQALASHGFITPNQEFKESSNNSTNMTRQQSKRSKSHSKAIILSIVAGICILLFVYFSFGSIIEENFINLLNPTKVQKKIQNKVDNPSNNQPDNNTDSTQTPNSSNNDDNSQSSISPSTDQSDSNNSSLNNVTDKVKNQINSITDKTKNNNAPQQNNNQNDPNVDGNPQLQTPSATTESNNN